MQPSFVVVKMSAKEKENESYVWWMCGETLSMLKIRKEIECYDKVMELHPNYQDKV